jgi:hypothetical protein
VAYHIVVELLDVNSPKSSAGEERNMGKSLLRHISRAVLFAKYRGARMAMLTAYFDASGKDRLPVLTVAGFISHVKKWDRFEGEWRRILTRYGVSEMHMTDFASSRGQFCAWKGQTEKRRAFISELASCVKRNVNKGFSCSVVAADYRKVNREYRLSEEFGSPYELCGGSCLGGVLKWALNKKINPTSVVVCIEDGDDGKGGLMDLGRSGGFKIIPLAKADSKAFEAGRYDRLEVADRRAGDAIHGEP